jgi:hypothetical protein
VRKHRGIWEASQFVVGGLHLGCDVERNDDRTGASSELQVSSPDLTKACQWRSGTA